MMFIESKRFYNAPNQEGNTNNIINKYTNQFHFYTRYSKIVIHQDESLTKIHIWLWRLSTAWGLGMRFFLVEPTNVISFICSSPSSHKTTGPK